VSIDGLIGGPARSKRSAIVRGEVVDSPPGDTDLWAIVPSYSQTRHYEIPDEQWISAATGPPSAGDECLLLFDDLGDVWAIVGGSG
jgi:hypothetical protein